MKRLTAVLLTGILVIMCCSCSNNSGFNPPATEKQSSQNPGKSEEIFLTRPLVSEEQQKVNAATASAVRTYVEARIKTDAFVAADFASMTDEATTQMIDGLAMLWSLVLEQAEAAQGGAAKPLSKSGKNGIQVMQLAATTHKVTSNVDAEKWAENLTKQYDSIKGNNTVKQLAAQLGVDAKTAYAQLTLAQDIIRSGAEKDAAYFDKLTKVAQATKTACKVGLFVTATIATGGGTLGALATSSMTIGQAGAVIVGGTDCIVDVASTGSTILLGENSQVTMAFNEKLKDRLAPVSAVVGLVTFNSSSVGEQIAYIGDTLSDWLFEDKVLGVKVTGDSDGMSVMAKALSTASMTPQQIAQELQDSGFVVHQATEQQQPAPGISPTTTPAMPDVSTTPVPSTAPSQSAASDNGTLAAKDISGTYDLTVSVEGWGDASCTASISVSGDTATISDEWNTWTFNISGNILTKHFADSEQLKPFVLSFEWADGTVIGSGVLTSKQDGSTTTYTYTKVQ